jgi:hypothetical protein
MIKTFASAKNIYMVSFIWTLVIVLPLPVLYIINTGEWWKSIVPGIMVAVAEVIFISILLNTKYIIRGSYLYYYSGPLKGKIAIASIRKIENNSSFIKGSTLKPCLGRIGFIIHYNKLNDIFVSPKDKEGFLEEILKIKPDIAIA